MLEPQKTPIFLIALSSYHETKIEKGREGTPEKEQSNQIFFTFDTRSGRL
jgi:hypothetical protein